MLSVPCDRLDGVYVLSVPYDRLDGICMLSVPYGRPDGVLSGRNGRLKVAATISKAHRS